MKKIAVFLGVLVGFLAGSLLFAHGLDGDGVGVLGTVLLLAIVVTVVLMVTKSSGLKLAIPSWVAAACLGIAAMEGLWPAWQTPHTGFHEIVYHAARGLVTAAIFVAAIFPAVGISTTKKRQ